MVSCVFGVSGGMKCSVDRGERLKKVSRQQQNHEKLHSMKIIKMP